MYAMLWVPQKSVYAVKLQCRLTSVQGVLLMCLQERRERLMKEQLEKMRADNPKITEQFADLKRDLAQVRDTSIMRASMRHACLRVVVCSLKNMLQPVTHKASLCMCAVGD